MTGVSTPASPAAVVAAVNTEGKHAYTRHLIATRIYHSLRFTAQASSTAQHDSDETGDVNPTLASTGTYRLSFPCLLLTSLRRCASSRCTYTRSLDTLELTIPFRTLLPFSRQFRGLCAGCALCTAVPLPRPASALPRVHVLLTSRGCAHYAYSSCSARPLLLLTPVSHVQSSTVLGPVVPGAFALWTPVSALLAF